MSPSRLRALCVALLFLITNLQIADGAVAKRRRRGPRRKAVAAVPADVAVGGNLQERLTSLMNGSVARSGQASLQVVELDTGNVVAQRDPDLPLAPASNMKLFTTAASIDLLKPSFEVTTTVYKRGTVANDGTLDGDLKVVGHGDQTIGGRFHDGHATAVIEEWVGDIQRAGIKTIHGSLIFEYGYMDTEYIHPTWPVDQLVNWYEAPVSAFSLQESCVEVRVMPSRPGKACTVQLEPPTSYINVESTCVTGRGLPFITRIRGTNTVVVRGGVPARSGPTEVFVTVENPIHYFAAVTAEAFARNGVTVQGQIVIMPRDA